MTWNKLRLPLGTTSYLALFGLYQEGILCFNSPSNGLTAPIVAPLSNSSSPKNPYLSASSSYWTISSGAIFNLFAERVYFH